MRLEGYRLAGQGHTAEGLERVRSALAMAERAVGPTHPEVGSFVKSLAEWHSVRNRPDLALPFAERLAPIYGAAGPAGVSVYGSALQLLGGLYLRLGDPGRAEIALQRSVEVLTAGPARDDAGASFGLSALASLYLSIGEVDRADTFILRAIPVWEAQLRAGNPVANGNLAAMLQVEAEIRRAQGRLDDVARLVIRARDLNVSHDTPQLGHPPDQAVVARRVADLVSADDDLERTEIARWQAVEAQRTSGAERPAIADALTAFARTRYLRGAYHHARAMLERSLEILEDSYGPDSLRAAPARFRLGLVDIALGRSAEAPSLMRASFLASEERLRSVRLTATDARVAHYLSSVRSEDEMDYSLFVSHPDDPDATRLALTAALLRKGRSLDESAGASRAIQQGLSPADRTRFDRLRALRSTLAELLLRGGASSGDEASALRTLREEADTIERDLSQRSASLRATTQLPSPDQFIARVAAAVPQSGALVEIVEYRRYVFGDQSQHPGWEALRYAGFVLTHDGQARGRDLGEAAPIDAAVGALLRATTHPTRADAPELGLVDAARALDRLVMDPLRPLLGARTDLIVSPDGQLGLVPFALFHDGRGFLVDRYRFTYVTSGRDLLREPTPPRADAPMVIVADPDFAAGAASPSPAAGQTRAFAIGHVPPLPGTRVEAQAIAQIIPTARTLLGAAATEDALLGLVAPTALHVATHGIFLADADIAREGSRGLTLRQETSATAPGARPAEPATVSDPLVRSALLLAGVQNSGSGGGRTHGDGLATALEIAGMNLWGTQLVTLSACETGRGDVQLGQGVYGLRRAVMAAGAETLVTSLWRVDDDATRDLMISFYRNLLQGVGRVDAMQRASVAVRSAHPHPYFWAPFIVIGRDGPLQGLGGAR